MQFSFNSLDKRPLSQGEQKALIGGKINPWISLSLTHLIVSLERDSVSLNMAEFSSFTAQVLHKMSNGPLWEYIYITPLYSPRLPKTTN